MLLITVLLYWFKGKKYSWFGKGSYARLKSLKKVNDNSTCLNYLTISKIEMVN